jgi:glucose uptake protein
MILPASHVTVLILLVFGMLGWGLWANTFKLTGAKWRFELFYFDFAIGVVLVAMLLALTAGNLGFDGFSFMDDLRLAGKRQDLFGFVGGIIFNLGNMLLLAAVSVAGMTVAFPVAMGFALVIAACWSFALNPGGNTAFLLLGVVVLLGAVILAILTSKAASAANAQHETAPSAGKAKPKKRSTAKSVFLSLTGGLLLGSFSPLIDMGRAGENGLGPYSIGFIFALGVLFSTFVFNLFFMNLPVQGEPVDIADYFRAPLKRHIMGLLGGVLWYSGLIATLVVSKAEGPAQLAVPVTYVLQQAGIVIAALCGVFLWREFDGAQSNVKVRVGIMLILLAVGIGFSAAGLPAPR